MALKQGNVATFGAASRRYREGISQRRDVRGNVATLQRVALNDVVMLVIHVATLESGIKQRRNVEYQRRDVPGTHKNSRRDVDYSRRDVPESIKIDVVTLEIHVATLQKG